ncbi:MAG: MotA/TolQ/ExbB proton channel family protein [Myxococcota bacterium]
MSGLWSEVRTFMDTGGPTLWWIFAAALALWILAVERGLFFLFGLPPEAKARREAYRGTSGWPAWRRLHQRRRLTSEVRLLARQRLWLIRSLVALCPLLGLLGTVLGMLEVFDVMSVAGNGNARAMAAGVSQATLSTLAGMGSALSGLFVIQQLERTARARVAFFRDDLTALTDHLEGVPHGATI